MYRKRLDENNTRMRCVVLNKSWKQHPTKQQPYGHLSSLLQTIHVKQTRQAEHCWKSKDVLISDILLWTPIHERTSQEVLPEVMHDKIIGVDEERERERERVRELSVVNVT